MVFWIYTKKVMKVEESSELVYAWFKKGTKFVSINKSWIDIHG